MIHKEWETMYQGSQREELYSYSIDVEKHLINRVKSGDRREVKKIVESIYCENFQIRSLPPVMARLLLFELHGTLIKLLEDVPSEKRRQSFYEIQQSLQMAEDEKDTKVILGHLQILFCSLCDIFDEQKKSHNTHLIEKIIDYINAAYIHGDLCLSSVATHFDLSEVYLSQFFKEQTGEKFSKYLERVRITHAQELLLHTNFPINDIARRVGYNCSITFRRAFRRMYGVNPSSYLQETKVKPLFSDNWWPEEGLKAKELIFAHTDPPGGPREKTAQFFAEKVREYTKGDYRITTYPSSMLGYDTKLLQLAAAGGIDFVVAGSAIYGKYVKEMSLLLSPFLVETLEQGWHLYDDSYWVRIWYKELETKGFKMLSTWEAGFRCLTTRFPVLKPADLQGITIRVPPNPIHLSIWKHLGANPVSMEMKNVYAAIQEGRIDGQENPITTIWIQKFYEVAKFITLTRHSYAPLPLSISMRTWERLSARNQQAILHAAKEAAVYSRKLVSEQQNQMLKDMEKAGATIYHPDLQVWHDAMSQAVEAFRKEYEVLNYEALDQLWLSLHCMTRIDA